MDRKKLITEILEAYHKAWISKETVYQIARILALPGFSGAKAKA